MITEGKIRLDEIIDAFIFLKPTLTMKEIKNYVWEKRGSLEGKYRSRYSFDQTIQKQVERRCPSREGFSGEHVFDLVYTGTYKLANHDHYEKLRITDPDEYLLRSVGRTTTADLEITTRKLREVNIIQRKLRLVLALKKLYDNKCQICGTKLKISNTRSYSEVHHIRPLGEPHNGPDKSSNMLVVCPNCHVLLDFKAIKLSKDILTFKVPHAIDDENIAYANSTQIVSE